MSNPSTPQPSSTKDKSSRKSKSKSSRRKRRGSGASNASIISIDYASLKKLRKFQAKVEKENKKQKKLYQQQKLSKFQDLGQKFIEQDKYHEFKEGQEDDESFDTYKSSNTSINKLGGRNKKTDSYFDENYDTNLSYDSSGSSYNKDKQGEVDITVEELLPLIKNLVDRHNKLQQEYDLLDREYREEKILMEDKISQLQRDDISITSDNLYKSNGSNLDSSRSSMIRSKLVQEYEDKIEILKSNYEDNLVRVQSQFQQDIETLNKQIKTLNKELNDADKENDALRQSLEALEHENQSLRISMNNNNKQFQNIKLLKNKNKQLMLENETLHHQIEDLEDEMQELMVRQEEQQRDMNNSEYLNPASPVHRGGSGMNMRPQTPTHGYAKTLVMGNRDSLEVGSNKGLSDHESNISNDLLHQIADYQDNASVDPYQSNHSSVEPMGNINDQPSDRGSNYDGDNIEEQDDEKKQSENDPQQMTELNILSSLAKYKNIGDIDPTSMAQILESLQQKNSMRHTGGTQHSSQNQLDNYSVESNYSDSDQKLEEQIDAIEDDIRELKDMVLSLMDSTNGISPSINANLGPLVRKINRMYVMLSGPMGPMESRTSHVHDDVASSMMPGRGMRRGRSPDNHHSHYDSDSEHGHNHENSSQYSLRTGSDKDNNGWIGWLTPYVNDWMPSIGFSAIILSTVYLLMKYRNNQRILPIGNPRVLRNKR